ncbi:cytochrome b [Pseudomonas spirodelae]|uniref:Cytochrome b n=1 Tax=Pseudomonas spirodelae TaxID=3101751 RepID=A0ABU5P4T9_9PSED|nr:cytochrome b [Pseudomonas sp. T5W1]MBU0522773.1 cytochrome b [Gammaproteobacteria bacterium]MBU0806657.1 cytochrome b [Gammaproteobacteria bacterium]MBU0882497.1 cytochrome b [Gammaproteobacteria bacterium]MBU1861088.1 cytochrome b [Gammaproteobacteria bacterium]MEA1604605.1 cytochrome b [Pseudomonas sp. T5W1]
MNDSAQRYGGISRLLHWAMALLIGWQLLKLGDRINDGEHWIGQTLVPWHVSIGSLLLILIGVRLLWALSQRQQRPQPVGPTAPLVKAGHGLLYASMLLMPLTGLCVMLGNGYGLKVFGVQLLAKTGLKTDWLISLGNLHSPLAWLLLALVVGHIGAALFHHFVKKDDTLKRMAG